MDGLYVLSVTEGEVNEVNEVNIVFFAKVSNPVSGEHTFHADEQVLKIAL